jgi:oligosaccharide repeat unit polymerase
MLGIIHIILEISMFPCLLIILSIWIIYKFIKYRTINLIDIWIISFVYIIGGEYLYIQYFSHVSYNYDLFLKSQVIFIISFGFTLIGYSLLLFLKKGDTKMLLDNLIEKNFTKQIKKFYKIIYIIQFIIISILFSSVGIVAFLSNKRTGQMHIKSESDLIIGSLFILMIVFPVISIYINKYIKSALLRIIGIAGSLMSIIYVLSTGTRFYIGYMFSAIIFLYIDRFYKIRKTKFIFLSILIILMLSTTLFMRDTRVIGVKNVNIFKTFKDISAIDILPYEGIFNITNLIISNFDSNNLELMYGKENAFILYFWIPRVIWHNKPVMTGYWLVRQLTSNKYSQAMSFSGGFIFPAIVDFGVFWGTLFCVFYGILIGYFEILFQKYRFAKLNPMILIISLLIFTVAFMMRSLQTSLINLLMFTTVGILPYYIVYRRIK